MEIRLIIWRYSSMARISSCLLQEKSSILFIAAMCSSEGLRALRLGDKASNSRGLDLDKSLKNCLVNTAKTSKFAETEIRWIRGKLPPALSDMWLSHLESVYKIKKTKVTSNGREGQSENSLLICTSSITAIISVFHTEDEVSTTFSCSISQSF